MLHSVLVVVLSECSLFQNKMDSQVEADQGNM